MHATYPLDRYGVWNGDRKGEPYEPHRCAYAIMDGYVSRQCSRKKGHGDKGLFCKQHSHTKLA